MNLLSRTGGEDTMHISLYLEWDAATLFTHTSDWQAAQDLGKYGYTDDNDSRCNGFTAGKYEFYVRPYGYNPDRKYHAKEAYYHYDLVHSGIRFSFSEREVRDENSPPNARIEIGSKPLMAWGLEECWKRVKIIIRTMGAKMLRHSVGRIDPCCDLPGVSIDTFQMAVLKKRIVTRAKKKSIYLEIDEELLENTTRIQAYEQGVKREGVMIGRGVFSCRIYDKLLESCHDEEKLEILREYRYGGKMPEVASRGEFQIRREGLRNLKIKDSKGNIIQDGIVTVEDWLKYRYNICMYLCTSWLRMYGQDFDRTHTDRLGVSDMLPAWQKLINGFECWTTQKPKDVWQRDLMVKKVKRQQPALQIDSFSLWRGALGIPNLGDYPHAELTGAATGKKKQSTRLVKLECPNCGMVIRTTKKWIEETGAPLCFCDSATQFELPEE